MRIGIDASCWANRRGFGRFTRCLVPEMVRRRPEHRYVLIADAATAGSVDGVGSDVERVAVPVSQPPTAAASAAGRRTVPDLLRMMGAARRARCDAFYFPSTYSYFPLPGVPSAVTVHDAIPETVPDLVFPDRTARFLWQLKQQVAVRQAAVVFTVSQAARLDLLDRLPVGKDVRVIREAPDVKFRPLPEAEGEGALARFDLAPGAPYLLYVGGISPHKNLELLIAAFEEVAALHSDLHLLIVGDMTDDPFLSAASSVRAAVERSATGGRVRLTGYVDDDALVALYGGALATVLPSLGEGFGLTAAESAACGTPVVASDLPALVELLGDTGLYADPNDAHSFAAAFARLLEDRDLSRRLGQASRERAASWSWAAAADSVVTTLEEIHAAAVRTTARRAGVDLGAHADPARR